MVISRRSCLSVPATQPRFFEKADGSAADLVFFDLEDSVAPSAKERGRELAVEALRTYEFRGKARGGARTKLSEANDRQPHQRIRPVLTSCS